MAKKIMIINGGARKNFNTASLLQAFAEGAKSVGSDMAGRKMAETYNH